MAYDRQYRKRVLEYLEEGHTQEEAHKVFKVGASTIWEWRKLYEETGSLEKRELKRSFKKVDPEKLALYIKEHPDAYLKEIAKFFQCDESAIRKALKKLKITRKKNESIR
jgi:transposase